MMTFFNKYIIAGLIVLMYMLTLESVSCQSNIKVETSPSVTRLMARYVENAKAKDMFKVWRIQILSSSDRREMESTLATFRAVYPDMMSDWKHVSPNYQVRAGYFESKNKLMPLLLEIKKSFPAATPVYDNVSKKALLGY